MGSKQTQGNKTAASASPSSPTTMNAVIRNFLTEQASITDDQVRAQFDEIRDREENYKMKEKPKTSFASRPENVAKNRYRNILPYDHSCVKLPIDIPLYVNASYIQYERVATKFIATQGPLPSTIDNFWTMVALEHVRLIAMLTNFEEGGKDKCTKYWLDNWTSYAEDTMHNRIAYVEKMEKQSTSRIYRYMLLGQKASQDKTKRHEIDHLHFTAWPDHGVPNDEGELLGFIDKMRKMHKANPDRPLLIHCSAGVGRTGTVIAIAIVKELIETGQLTDEDLNLVELVMKLRRQRVSMIQTPEQYAFLRRAIISICNQYLNAVQGGEPSLTNAVPPHPATNSKK